MLDEIDDEEDVNSLHLLARDYLEETCPDEQELQPGHAQFAGASSRIQVRPFVLYLYSTTSLVLGSIA